MNTHCCGIRLWCTIALVALATSSCKEHKADQINDMLTWSVASNNVAYSDERAAQYLMSIDESYEDLLPGFSVKLDILLPSTEQDEYKALCDSIAALQLRMLNIQHQASESASKEIELKTDSLLTAYKADVQEMVDMYQGADATVKASLMMGISEISYEQIHKDSLTYNANNVVSIVSDSYIYSGGAHGLVFATSLNYDLKANRPIEVEQLIAPDALPIVTTAIRDQLMQMYGVNTHEELENAGIFDYNDVKVQSNFYFGEQGITFVYNPYEIASYAAGIIKVTLPYSTLAPYLQSPYRSLAD